MSTANQRSRGPALTASRQFGPGLELLILRQDRQSQLGPAPGACNPVRGSTERAWLPDATGLSHATLACRRNGFDFTASGTSVIMFAERGLRVSHIQGDTE